MASAVTDDAIDNSKTKSAIAQLLAVDPGSIMVQSKQFMQGYAANDRGLKYNIEGRATRIEVQVGNALATFQDPIKALFGTRICEGQKVQVVRKYVVGGRAVATPERAPARIVKVNEDVKQVMLTRYGADLTMNLNLMLRPEDAREELQMKVDAQKQSLENELIRFGYAELLNGGTRLPQAVARSKGLKAANAASMERNVEHSIFAAFQRYENPLASLIAMAKSATAYRNVIGKDSLMILPCHAPELLEYNKYNKMTYKVNGIRATDKKALDVAVDDVYDDPTIGLKLMVHHPPQDISTAGGQAAPLRGSSPMFQRVMIIDATNGNAMNLATGQVETPPQKWRVTVAVMGCAVIGVPGANTGELLVGYPFTATSTNQRTESMTVSLRVYLGACLKQEDNVIVLPNVYLDHIESCNFYDDTNAKAKHDTFKGQKIGDPDGGLVGTCAKIEGTKVIAPSSSPFQEIDSPRGVHMAKGFDVFSPKCKLVEICDGGGIGGGGAPVSATVDLDQIKSKVEQIIDTHFGAAVQLKTTLTEIIEELKKNESLWDSATNELTVPGKAIVHQFHTKAKEAANEASKAKFESILTRLSEAAGTASKSKMTKPVSSLAQVAGILNAKGGGGSKKKK